MGYQRLDFLKFEISKKIWVFSPQSVPEEWETPDQCSFVFLIVADENKEKNTFFTVQPKKNPLRSRWST